IESVSKTLESEIVPPSKKAEVLDLSIEEIKKRYPTRYEIYLNVLRKQKKNVENVEIDEKEREGMSDWLESLNNLDKYIETHKANKDERTLRPRQFTVFEDLRKFTEEGGGGGEGYIKLPTGSGKTVIFSEFIEAFSQKTLVVVPTKLLVAQTEEELRRFIEKLNVGKIYADKKEFDKNVTITTYDSLVLQGKRGTLNPADYKLLILDEAHCSLSEKRMEAVNRFNKALKIGFTATPTYSPEKKVNQLLSKEIHNLGVKEAAEEGILSPFSVILAKTSIDLSNVSIASNGDYDEGQLEKAINKEARNKSAVDLYKEMFNGQLAVAYCVDVNHAKEVARLFNENGISADYVSGERQDPEILERFSMGEIKVLCNAKLLIAGFDEPKVSVCLNLKPTLSRVDAEQRGGRTLRLNKDNPEKHASIVDLIDETHKNPPITFAEIAGTASVNLVNINHKEEIEDDFDIEPIDGNNEDKDLDVVRHRKPIINIAGLKIIINAKEIMRIVSESEKKRNENLCAEEWPTFEDLKQEVKEVGITTGWQYRKESKNHSRWPSVPNEVYKKEWNGWSFLEKKEKWLSFEDLKQEVREAGIISRHHYYKAYKI
ncbi:MAG: DEAD/DEAH box helicase, partial [Patescibacteria group bacterium]